MRELNPEEHDRFAAIARQVGRETVRRYRADVELDDLIQEAWHWLLRHKTKAFEYLDDSNRRQGDRLIAAAVRNWVRDYARKERASKFGYDLDDDMFYSLTMLKGVGHGKGLLHYVYDRDAWTRPPKVDDGPRGSGDPAEGNGWLTTLIDVDRALKTLPRADQALLEAHFRNGYTYEEIGSSFPVPVTAKTVSLRVDAVCVKLQDALGGARPKPDPEEAGWEQYVGTRRVMSNAHARAITDNQVNERQFV